MKYLLAYFEEYEGKWVISEEFEFNNFEDALKELNFNYFACIDKEIEWNGITCWKTVARSSWYAEVYGK